MPFMLPLDAATAVATVNLHHEFVMSTTVLADTLYDLTDNL